MLFAITIFNDIRYKCKLRIRINLWVNPLHRIYINGAYISRRYPLFIFDIIMTLKYARIQLQYDKYDIYFCINVNIYNRKENE